MNLIKKMLGKILYGITKVIDVLMDTCIRIIESVVLFIKNISKGLFVLISMGGCLFFIIFIFWGLRLMMDPVGLLIILFFVLFPILAAKFVAYLKYVKYAVTEYLYNLSNYLMDSSNYKYRSLNQFKMDYRKAQEEKRREEQRRYYEKQKQWQEQFFRQQWHYQGGQQGSYSGGYNHNSYSMNPTAEFKKRYETSCDILEVPYNADKNKIKLAYRKKAKEYHPDINKDENATKMFQLITDAYEFLNDENILRYRNI